MVSESIELTVAELAKLTEEVRAPGGPPKDAQHTKRFNEAMVAALRAAKYHIDGELSVFPLLILTNKGAKSGAKRENPLAYFVVDNRLFVVASMGGADINPPWYNNVVANPAVVVELNGVAFPAVAKTVGNSEHESIYTEVCKLIPVFKDYQERTKRVIPVVELIASHADIAKCLAVGSSSRT
jgi:deazaflavin-dependent oxidoreductase (nitroreductase family)